MKSWVSPHRLSCLCISLHKKFIFQYINQLFTVLSWRVIFLSIHAKFHTWYVTRFEISQMYTIFWDNPRRWKCVFVLSKWTLIIATASIGSRGILTHSKKWAYVEKCHQNYLDFIKIICEYGCSCYTAILSSSLHLVLLTRVQEW